MAMFVVLGRFTDAGGRNVANLPKTVEENMARGQRLGITIHGWYLTQGQYDFVVLAEAPDAEAMLAQAAGVAGTGNARVETMRAFSLADAQQVIKRAVGA